MPLYRYKCTACGKEQDISVPMAQRDCEILCQDLTCLEKRRGPFPENAYDNPSRYAARMVRVPTSGSFVVNGYNAKNGYSK